MQLRAFLELARFSNLPTVWSNCVAAWMAGGRGDARSLGLALVGGSLVYTGGMFLNDYCDREFDHAHRRERPIPSGRASLREVGVMAALFIGLGGVCLAWLGPWLALALVLLVITYDCWHKNNPISPVLMAACRVMLVITVAGGFSAILLALGLGAFILAISMVAKREAFGAQPVPWLGMAVLLLAFAISPIGAMHLPPLWSWLLPILVVLPLRHLLKPAREIGKCVGGLLAAIPLVDLWNLAATRDVSVGTVALFAGLSGSAILLQRVAPAT